jgi:tripartite-type tricarboxylate transporter receptor subunit TctC
MREATQYVLKAILVACLLMASAAAGAQSYPTKPIQWIIPFAPGGGLDLLTRAYAPGLAGALGQPVVPVNRPANVGIIGAETLARSASDGHTLLTAGNSILTLAKLIYPKLPFDPERDFAPITQIADSPLALWIHHSIPVNSLQEFFSYVKANPGKLAFGAPGVGHPFHLAMEVLNQRAGMSMVFIPYKGSGPVMQDMFAGRLQAMFSSATSQMLSQLKAGKLRVLAFAAGSRLPDLPDTPTFEELGVHDFKPSAWMAVVAPAGTPRDIIERLNRELVRISSSPELAKTYAQLNMLAATTTPEQLGQKMSKEIAELGPVIKRLGIQLE